MSREYGNLCSFRLSNILSNNLRAQLRMLYVVKWRDGIGAVFRQCMSRGRPRDVDVVGNRIKWEAAKVPVSLVEASDMSQNKKTK